MRHLLLLLALVPLSQAQDAPVRRGGADPSDDASRMGSPPSLPAGRSEEEIWPSATAEGWAKPCLVHWQRTFDDALRVAREEHRPLLIAVNMDGEIASEHFAGVRYRQPETAAAMNRYACVVASVYRHAPRDWDEEGRRVECPRFGTVTCGEHVEAERELYEKYFDGRRIAPRHIVLDLEGRETYDVYYAWDTQTVFTTFAKGVEGWPEPLEREPGAREPEDLARSADAADREALEASYREGDRELRRRILVALAREPVVDQIEVLRMALFGLDLELAGLARRALARCETEGGLDLMAEALKGPLEESERALLLDAVERLAQDSPRARTLAALHGGLSVGSKLIDARPPEALALEYEASAGRGARVLADEERAREVPEDPAARLVLAASLVERAAEVRGSAYEPLFAADARAELREAERLGAEGPALEAVRALVAAGLGERGEARSHALAAVEAGLLRDGDQPDDAAVLTEASRARLLELFAEARQRAIRDAFRAGERWPSEWLSDVDAAFTELADGPFADEEALLRHHDFLRWIGASPRADEVLEAALARFPESGELHERLRRKLLWKGGPAGLEQGYAARLARAEAAGEAGQLVWFAGYASLVAAEHHRRRGELDAALADYARGIERFTASAERFPAGEDSCLHFVALAEAGRARVSLERGSLEQATGEMLRALATRPDSAATQDGLGITPLATAKMLLARLREAGRTEEASRLQAAMDALDPALLEPPPSELPQGRRRG